jgi:hypothetical protein
VYSPHDDWSEHNAYRAGSHKTLAYCWQLPVVEVPISPVHAMSLFSTTGNQEIGKAGVSNFGILRPPKIIHKSTRLAPLLQTLHQASATYGTHAKRGTWNDFQWHDE